MARAEGREVAKSGVEIVGEVGKGGRGGQEQGHGGEVARGTQCKARQGLG